MPEPPDFEKIARVLDQNLDDSNGPFLIAEQLRLVWNARGAADIAAVDDIAHTNYEAIADALRALDR
jgi:hypothetical protein